MMRGAVICLFVPQRSDAVSPGGLGAALDGGSAPHDGGGVHVRPAGQTHRRGGRLAAGRAHRVLWSRRRRPRGEEQPADAPPQSSGGQHGAGEDVPASGERSMAEGPQHRRQGQLSRALAGARVQHGPQHAAGDAEGETRF